MTTTIKLSSAVRDRLREQASAAHRTLGEQVEFLLELGDRNKRFAELENAIANTPDALRASYEAETAAWESIDS